LEFISRFQTNLKRRFFFDLSNKDFKKFFPPFVLETSASQKLPQIFYFWLIFRKIENLILCSDFSLFLLEVLVYASDIIVCCLLKKTFVLNVLKETKQISLVDTAVAIHVEKIKNELFREQQHFSVRSVLTHYLLLELLVERSIV
jgi:hypothetical protein